MPGEISLTGVVRRLGLVLNVFIIFVVVNNPNSWSLAVSNESPDGFKTNNSAATNTSTSSHSVQSKESNELPTISTTENAFKALPSSVNTLFEQPTSPSDLLLDSMDVKLDDEATTTISHESSEPPARTIEVLISNVIEDRMGVASSAGHRINSEDISPGNKLEISTATVQQADAHNDQHKTTLENTTQPQLNQTATTPNPSSPLGPMLNSTDLKTLETNDSVRTSDSELSKGGLMKKLESKAEIKRNDLMGSNGLEWSNPFGGSFFVPQINQEPESSTQPVLTPSQAPEPENDNQLIQETIIPKANIIDLLRIIKHLNLMEETRNSFVPFDFRRTYPEDSRASNLFQLYPNSAEERMKQEDQDDFHRSSITADRSVAIPMMASSSSPKGTLDQSQPVAPSKRRSTKTSSSRLNGIRNQKGAESKLLAKFAKSVLDQTLNTTKPAKLSLISPYSANFDTELQSLTNVPINRASSSGSSKDDDTHSSKQAHVKPSAKIGSRPDQSQGALRSSTRSKLVQVDPTRSESQTQTTPSTTTQRHHIERPTAKSGNQIVAKKERAQASSSKPTKQTTEPASDATSPKRGERDAIKIKVDNQRNKPQRNKSGEEISSGITTVSNQIEQPRFKHPDSTKPPKRINQSVIEQEPRPSNSYDASEIDPYGTGQKVADSYYTDLSNSMNPLDDPHKKSYYWLPQQTSLYSEDLNNGQVDNYARPLTVGELAQHHGVHPLYDLARPSEVPDQPGVNQQYGSPSASVLHEEFKQFTGNQPAYGIKGGIALDEDSKKQMAVKAFEAALRDSEISAALFGNLFSLNTAAESQQITPTPTASNLAPDPYRNYQYTAPSIMSNSSPMGDNHLGHRQPINGYGVPKTPKDSSNPFHMMLPMATAMQNQVTVSNAVSPQLISAIHQNPAASGTASDGSPLNLVITDLANKWALSRMPDLVPIPLAATVPGYLIRLPNGKIMAAALTNMFSIQGIQREPLTENYKAQTNQKLKGLASRHRPKVVRSQPKQPPQHSTYANLASDSGLSPTIVLPNQNNKLQSPPSRFKGPTRSHGGVGLFGRGVINQLGFLTSKSYAQQTARPSNNQRAKAKPANNQKGNLLSRPKMIDLLKSLPIAEPNEPVFSFSDESELLDEPDFTSPDTAASLINQVSNFRQSRNQMLGNDQVFSSSHQLQATDLLNNPGKLFELKSKLEHLLEPTSAATLFADQLFPYKRRKRKSSARFPMAKLDPIISWLTNRRTLKRRDLSSTPCNDKD